MAISISFVELCLVGIAIYLGLFLLKRKRDPRFPPGPGFALPVIGNLLQIGSNPQKVFEGWAKKYGTVFSFKMGSDDLIVLNDAKIIKVVFAEASSTGRTSNPIYKALTAGKNYGIITGEGEHWEQQRRFTLRTLRDLGLAKTSSEGIVLSEINALCRFMEKRVGKPISGYRLFNAPVVNVLWSLVSGERHDWEGPETPKIMRYANDILDSLNATVESGLMFAPALRYIAPDYFGWTRWIKSIANTNSETNITIEQHSKNLKPDSPQDLIDHYLLEMQGTTDPESSFYKETGEKNLTAVIPDLFLAGSETTSHSLSWLILHLSHHPEVMEKLQKEIDTVVGPGRQPSVTDRPNLPYTEATIMEILRRTSVVINGVPHRMLQDAVINGFFFPKNTTLFSNIFYVHNNPEVWGDPENFRPERFLSEDGTTIVRNDNFIPFSTGRRVCLGESLARDTLFLFLACIAQKFDLRAAPGNHPERLKDVTPDHKMLNDPGRFEFIATLRK